VCVSVACQRTGRTTLPSVGSAFPPTIYARKKLCTVLLAEKSAGFFRKRSFEYQLGYGCILNTDSR